MSQLILTSQYTLMPWHIRSAPGDELFVSNKPVASGGYGTLYELESILDHELPKETKWLVKLCSDDNQVNKAGFERVKRLFGLIREWQLQLGYNNVEEILLHYGPFIGFPQATFTCKLEDGSFYGYLMPDLNSLGFLPFADFDEQQTEIYISGLHQTNIWQARLKGVHSLAKTLGLLHNAFNFLHGDLKAESIWYHPTSNKFALIDYDGGSFRKNRVNQFLAKLTEPQIKGTVQAWLAPEIMKETDEETGKASLKVTSHSDLWSFACCAFQLLSGVNAFIFLNPDVYESRLRYHKQNVWPSLSPINQILSFTLDEQSFLESCLTTCQSRPKIWQLFTRTFHKGFNNLGSRPDYHTWENALASEVINKTSSIFLEVKPKAILENEEVLFKWECQDAHFFINGINHKAKGSTTLLLRDYPDLKVVNTFGEWPVSVPLEIIRKPRIHSLTSSASFVKKDDLLQLQWDADFVEKILISANGKTVVATGKQFSFIPDDDQEIRISFISKHSLHTETRSIGVEVVKPIEIGFFKVDRAFIAETLPVQFSWHAKYAEKVTITGFDRIFDPSSEIKVRPKHSGEYTLVASNRCFTVEQSIYVEVLPVPKIDHLTIPKLPSLDLTLPDLARNVPAFMDQLRTPLSIFNKVFDEQND